MKITKRLLEKTGCCKEGIQKFMNTSELHDIDFKDIKTIVVKDSNIYDDIIYFLNKINFNVVDQVSFNDNKNYYDKNGNLIKVEYSNGDWETYEYDKNNNLIKEEDSNGYWKTYEYDKNNNLIKEEYSDGHWYIYEYDKNNNKIKVEYSDGYCATYEIKKYDMNKIEFITN